MQTTYVEVFWYRFRKRLRKIWQKKGVRICVRCCLVRGLLLLLVEIGITPKFLRLLKPTGTIYLI